MSKRNTNSLVNSPIIPGCYIDGTTWSGKNSKIYKGKLLESGKEICIKSCISDKNNKCYKREKFVYELVRGATGFPYLYNTFETDKDSYIIIDLMGMNIAKYKEMIKHNFSLKTTLMLADQMISRLEYLHKKGIVHRDVKPENFVMGRLSRLNQVSLIDFGLSKPYIDIDNGHLVHQSKPMSFSGTLKFASINSLRLGFYCPADDMESLMYSLISLIKGLPWDREATTNVEFLALQREINTPSEICEGLPEEFQNALEYIRSLKPFEEIDYTMIKQSFRDLFFKFEYLYDGRFDWMGVKAPPKGTARAVVQAITQGNKTVKPDPIKFIPTVVGKPRPTNSAHLKPVPFRFK